MARLLNIAIKKCDVLVAEVDAHLDFHTDENIANALDGLWDKLEDLQQLLTSQTPKGADLVPTNAEAPSK